MNDWLALDVAPARLGEIALGLGADVPFFLVGTPARVRGIGENVQPIVGFGALALVVAIPPVAVSTAWAFRAFAELVPSPAVTGDEAARLAAGAPVVPALLVNDLERVGLPAFPAVAELKRLLLASGAQAGCDVGERFGGGRAGSLARRRRAYRGRAAGARGRGGGVCRLGHQRGGG